MSNANEIRVQVNGEPKTVTPGTTMLDLLHSLGVNEKRVAVEWNRQIVKSDVWTSRELQAGDEIEVVHFVGGGAGGTTCCG